MRSGEPIAELCENVSLTTATPSPFSWLVQVQPVPQRSLFSSMPAIAARSLWTEPSMEGQTGLCKILVSFIF